MERVAAHDSARNHASRAPLPRAHPKARLHDIGDARLDIEEIQRTLHTEFPPQPSAMARGPLLRRAALRTRRHRRAHGGWRGALCGRHSSRSGATPRGAAADAASAGHVLRQRAGDVTRRPNDRVRRGVGPWRPRADVDTAVGGGGRDGSSELRRRDFSFLVVGQSVGRVLRRSHIEARAGVGRQSGRGLRPPRQAAAACGWTTTPSCSRRAHSPR